MCSLETEVKMSELSADEVGLLVMEVELFTLLSNERTKTTLLRHESATYFLFGLVSLVTNVYSSVV